MTQRQTRTYTNRRYLDAIEDHVVLFDGATGTNIQRLNLTADDFGGERYNGLNEHLVLVKPDVIEWLHTSFLEVGSEAVETCTFRGNRLTLGEFGLADKTLEINRKAAEIARSVCDHFEQETGIPRFVAGSMGPSGKLPSGNDPDLSNITFNELADVFYEQAKGLVEGGADLLLVETSQDILEVKAAVDGIQRCFADTGKRIPIQAQVTLDTTGRMLFGTDIASALATLESLPIDVIGMNCSTGPEYMRAPIQYLIEHSTLPISVLPNAGLPINVDGEAVYPMEPEPFSDMVAEFARWGVNVVGGCCGSRPEHIEQIYRKVHGHSYQEFVEAIGKQPHPHPLPEFGEGSEGRGEIRLAAPKPRTPEHEAVASSGMKATPMVQNPGPTMIGERVNSQGISMPKRCGTPVGRNLSSSCPQRSRLAEIGTWICVSVERSSASGCQCAKWSPADTTMAPSLRRTAIERRSLLRSSMNASVAWTRGTRSGSTAAALVTAASSASAVRPSRSAAPRSGSRPKNAAASRMLATRNASPVAR